MYGYRSVEVLSRLVRGDNSDLKSQFLDIPAQSITADNVDEFQAHLAKMLGGGTTSKSE
jgi:hypothetical protein